MIDQPTLAGIEADVTTALSRGDASGLTVLGYGEISLVIGWPGDSPQWACKRLPPFGSRSDVDAFSEILHRYIDELGNRGVNVVDTEVMTVPTDGDKLAVYCVQPVLDEASLAVAVVRADPDRGAAVLGEIVATALNVVSDRVGLDAQLSNWGWRNGSLEYFDVTTPLLRHADGTPEVPTGMYLASLPGFVRAAVRRFVLPGIIERYHQPRTVVLDLAANLIKERLDEFIPAVLAAANVQLAEPLTAQEVRRDYRSDARTWRLIQALRRADRVYQQRIRRRAYPFLLPEPITR